MRFFIALEIPKQNIPQFQAIQDKLHILIPQLRITDLDKIHLTFAFVGEQLDSLKDPLIKVLKEAAKGIYPFEITPAYIDGFPNIHHPDVLWTGIKGDIDKIIILRERIKDGLEKLKLDTDERRFTPHITIAKLDGSKTNIDLNLEEKMQSLMQGSFTPIKVSSIKLIESIAEGGLHKHNTLAEIKLQTL